MLKRLTIIALSLLLMTAGLRLPSFAFTNCKRRSCLKKQMQRAAIGGFFTQEIDDSSDDFIVKDPDEKDIDDEPQDPVDPIDEEIDDGETKDPVDPIDEEIDDGKPQDPVDPIDEETDDPTPPDDSDDGDTPAGPGTGGGAGGGGPPVGPGGGAGPGAGGGGAGGGGISDACATNIAKFSSEKSFLACKIATAIRKARQVIAVYVGLQNKMKALLRTMRGVRVCTGRGYYPGLEFRASHSLQRNINKMRSLVRLMLRLQNKLAKISLDCTNCDDAALAAALAKLADIEASFNTAKADFSAEMASAEARYANFIARLEFVASIHSVDPWAIMAECGVSFRRALRMAAGRRRVLRAIDALKKYKSDVVDPAITKIDFGSHTCVKIPPGVIKFIAACIDAII